MSSGKYGKLCPVTLGLALGLTCALGVLVGSGWEHYALPMLTVGHMMQPVSSMGTWVIAGWCLLKGFVAGFVFALIYDLICCCKSKCCKKSDGGGCGCGCASCSCGSKPKAG